MAMASAADHSPPTPTRGHEGIRLLRRQLGPGIAGSVGSATTSSTTAASASPQHGNSAAASA